MSWLAERWSRRKCPHNWELVKKEKILGTSGLVPSTIEEVPGQVDSGIGYHYIYVYRCRNCAAIKRKNDRWSPIQ
jgi:hypothetical protein